MKTSEIIAIARLANAAVAVEPNPREKQKAALEKQLSEASILKECCDTKWTFATKKLKGGSCILLAKPKYSFDRYREICRDGQGLKFKTKTSAHYAAKQICELGLTEAGYELGQEYSRL